MHFPEETAHSSTRQDSPSNPQTAAELRIQRSQDKLRGGVAASVVNTRRSDVLEPADRSYVVEEVELHPPAESATARASARIEPSFVSMPSDRWESGLCCVLVCAFGFGCFVGGGLVAALMLAVRSGV
jgi:hypothetical protein